MDFSFSAFIYKTLIDPILSRLHEIVISNIEESAKVIDVACGTGSQALAIAHKASYVEGIDLSSEMISFARREAIKRDIKNIQFEIRDASDLSVFKDHEFDVAVTSMAIHQFDASLAVNILKEMKRIAGKIIIVDYNYPITSGFYRSLVFWIERFAGGDHFRNFRIFAGKGGIRFFTESAGLIVRSSVVRGKGVFQVSVCT